MTGTWARVVDLLEAHGRLARVSVVAVTGSAPREVGAELILRPDGGFHGTIGGGALEWRALDLARAALAARDPDVLLREVVLGPDLGQCCGGRVTLAVEFLDRAALAEALALAAAEAAGPFRTRAAVGAGRLDRRIVAAADRAPLGLHPDRTLIERFGDDRRPLVLFGAGHLGRAVVLALAPLPFRLDWVDERPDAFPAAMPANVRSLAPAEPPTALAAAPAGAFVLVATHDHARDFALVDAALSRPDLPWIGVVGSLTKRARFVSRLSQIGHDEREIRRMVCPIGSMGIRSKHPAVIAAAVAVELLVADEATRGSGEVRDGDACVREEKP